MDVPLDLALSLVLCKMVIGSVSYACGSSIFGDFQDTYPVEMHVNSPSSPTRVSSDEPGLTSPNS